MLMATALAERQRSRAGRASASYLQPAQAGDGVWGRSPQGDTAEVRPPVARTVGHVDRLAAAALQPVSNASCAVHRILLGSLCAFGAARFLSKGWVEALYLAPEHHLTYAWLPLVRPLPAPLMYAAVASMIPLGLAIAAGYRARLAAVGYLAVFTWCELIDAATYLNHYWYLTLALTLVVALPMSGRWSVDAHVGRVAQRSTVPAVVVWLLRGQLAVVYLMAGIAKLNHDWMVRGEPMSIWLASRGDMPVLGPLLDDQWVGRAASWGGAVFDLTIIGWLLWRRSRPIAYLAVVGFHVVTWLLFPIGVFPWVMMAGTLIFFPPDWPLRRRPATTVDVTPTPPSSLRLGRVVVAGLAVWALVQVAIPLRHLARPGDVRWTEEGYYGSFRVMLTEKAGWLRFEVTDPASATTWTIDPADVLEDWQVTAAATRADLTLAAAHIVADLAERDGHAGVEVRADSYVSFNGRPRQRMIDPAVDLAALSRRAPASSYVLALDRPVTE